MQGKNYNALIFLKGWEFQILISSLEKLIKSQFIKDVQHKFYDSY